MNADSIACYHQLISHYRATGIGWASNNNSNHLPMAIGALVQLGAPASRINEYAQYYAQRLDFTEKPAPQGFANAAAAQTELGSNKTYFVWLASFDNWIAQGNVKLVLRQWLPLLLPGAGAAGFHGLIRTAYGVLCANNSEVAAGLAYWASLFMPAQVVPALPAQNMTQALRQIEAGPLVSHKWTQPPITGRLRAVLTSDLLGQSLPALNAQQGLQDGAIAFAHCYSNNMDFTTLHCITGLHAAQILLAHTNYSSEQMLPILWPTLAAAHVVAHSDNNQTNDFLGDLPWPEITKQAIANQDDHVIKLVYTCLQWHGLTGADIFRICASKVVSCGNA
jgi:hypothetical protein